LAYRPAHDSEIGNVSVAAAALLAEVEELRRRLAALEARLPRSAVADPPKRRQAIRQPRPQSETETAEREPDTAARLARRRALGLGALASLFAFIGRSTARAADALTIDPDGATIYAKYINFGNRFGALLRLWEPDYEFGIQPSTLYARSYKNFAWYKGGTYLQEELKPGGGGSTMMSLSDGNLAVSGNVTAGGIGFELGGLGPVLRQRRLHRLPPLGRVCDGAPRQALLQRGQPLPQRLNLRQQRRSVYARIVIFTVVRGMARQFSLLLSLVSVFRAVCLPLRL